MTSSEYQRTKFNYWVVGQYDFEGPMGPTIEPLGRTTELKIYKIEKIYKLES